MSARALSLAEPAVLVRDEPHVVCAPDKRFYQPELDCLRFVAFLSVFCYHCIPSQATSYTGWPHALVSVIVAAVTAGQFGVPIFFVLSAYLITSLLLREKERTGSLDKRSFYMRRILRIWPLYYAFLLVASLLPFLTHSRQISAAYIVGCWFFVGNWVQGFTAYSPASLMAHPLWTVSIEEQFYLLWPLVIGKASRASIAKIAIALLFVANLSRVFLAFSGIPYRFRIISYSTVSNLDPIALGVLLALVLKEPPVLSALKRIALFLACMLAMIGVGGIINVHIVTGAIVGQAVVAFASAGILVAFLGAKNKVVRNPIVQYLGKTSYGMYVIHLFMWLCVVHVLNEFGMRHQTIEASIEVAVVALAVTVAVAFISYKWLEVPFLRLKEQFTYVRSRPV